MSCDEAEAGADDDLTLKGTDKSVSLRDCACSLEGVVDYCASTHTSTDLDTLKSCEESDAATAMFYQSNAVAEARNGGSALWIEVDGTAFTLETNETDVSLASWATRVLGVVCQALHDEGSIPETCESYLYPGSAL